MNSYIRIVATQCSPGTWFVSGICVDTLHKGDTEDNYNNNLFSFYLLLAILLLLPFVTGPICGPG